MNSPVSAMIWVCWRMTWRWYMPVLLIAIGFGEFVFNDMGNIGVRNPMSAAKEIVILAFFLACLTTLSAMSLSNKEGFPFRYQFRQPISTVLLVAIPTLYMSVLCASIIFIPLLLFKLQFAIPFSILPPVAIIMVLAFTLLTASWATTSTGTRGIGLLCALFFFVFFINWQISFNFVTSAATGIIPLSEVIVLPTPGLIATLLTIAVLLGIIILSVRQQRCDENTNLFSVARSLLKLEKNSPRKMANAKPAFFEKLGDWFTFPCPDDSPWRAEAWLEMKRFGIPILLFGTMLAMTVPVLLIVESLLDWDIGKFVYLLPLCLFFTAIGIALFNRRMDSGGTMNAFEASRGMGTLQVMVIQFGALALSILAGILIISLSIRLFTLLFPIEDNVVTLKLQAYWLSLSMQSLPTAIAIVVIALVYFMTTIAGFFCMHSCSVFWGKKFMIGMLILVFYIMNYLMILFFNGPTLESLIQNMWGASILIFGISALGVAGILVRRTFTLHTWLIALAIWCLYLVIAWIGLDFQPEKLSAMGGEMRALNGSVLVLPLGCFLLCAWCYDRLRHG